MGKITRNLHKIPMISLTTMALILIVVFGAFSNVRADEADAKRILKAMSDHMADQKAISFGFDATLEVVTKDDQKLALASSGTVILNRPDKVRVTRAGGHPSSRPHATRPPTPSR